MSHSSEKRWSYVAGIASEAASSMVTTLLDAESKYQDLLELYAYTGGTAQDFANQLFKETWEARSTPGNQADLSIDVASGSITGVTINDGGSGYDDGIDFLIAVPGGGGDAVIRYDVVLGAVTNATVDNAGTTYTDGLGQGFPSFPAPGVVFDTQANAEEVGKAQDLIDATTALHEIYQAADNVVVAQEDRLTQLRRFT